ncbi:hypothetical protein [uncultured Shewanella sp.]|uniref:hypothetical protein n=1 Tax=uncultured Shewanella sp. TaxID=173975 RepID=UPI0026201218|nr:hypothetical protein [uncultured Shewanella sp.]
MQQTKQQKLADIQKKMTMVAVIDFPGTLLVAAGLYGIFSGFGIETMPMLDNSNVHFAMLGIGGVIMLWGLMKMFQLAKLKQQVENGES